MDLHAGMDFDDLNPEDEMINPDSDVEIIDVDQEVEHMLHGGNAPNPPTTNRSTAADQQKQIVIDPTKWRQFISNRVSVTIPHPNPEEALSTDNNDTQTCNDFPVAAEDFDCLPILGELIQEEWTIKKEPPVTRRGGLADMANTFRHKWEPVLEECSKTDEELRMGALLVIQCMKEVADQNASKNDLLKACVISTLIGQHYRAHVDGLYHCEGGVWNRCKSVHPQDIGSVLTSIKFARD